MKKQILASLLACASAATSMAAVTTTPGDRIDLYTGDDTFQSILVDDIKNISYAGDPANGFTHIIIETAGSSIKLPIGELRQLLYKSIDGTAHEIKVTDAQKSRFRMLYNFNDPNGSNPVDPDRPYGWRGGQAGDPVFFLLAPAKGFQCDYTITGDYTGFNYLENIRNFVTEVSAAVTAQFSIGLDCFMYTMPYEPVTMTLTERERDDYAGLDILGSYHGGHISTFGRRLRSSTSDELTYTLKANTTFEFKSIEDAPIDMLDCYTYIDSTARIENIPDPDDVNQHPQYLNVKWGVSADITSDGVLFIAARYIPEPLSSNNRRYFAMSAGSTFTVADGDEHGMRQLLEITPADGEPLYYYFENYGYKRVPVKMEFTSGTTIASPSVAYIVYDGQRQVKYTLAEGSNPVMTVKGAEAGTYSYTGSGTHTSLTLDGFGTAIIDGSECAYSISSGVVTLELAVGNFVVIIDTAGNTYTEKGQAKWNGPKTFSTTKATGAYMGGAENDNCSVTLMLDQNYNGSTNEGYAVIKVTVPRSDYYQPLEIQGSGGEYVYDAEARTITVSNVKSYMWTGSAWQYGGYNITFHLSEDLRSAWMGTEVIGDRLWGMKRDGSYILTGESCLLTAEEP